MTGYYAERLSGRRLERCYELAPPRVAQYLEAEILHACSRLRQEHTVLELGCGYGRIAFRLAELAHRVVGIDNAPESLQLARASAVDCEGCEFLEMDALDLRFPDGSFDAVLCLQNGICAFGVDACALVEEALRVTRPRGHILLSSYADRFWPHRLAWFEAQAEAGLLGAIDREASRDGVIVCTDGFRAGRMGPEDFEALASRVGCDAEIEEVDDSIVFCELRKPSAPETSSAPGAYPRARSHS